jgi:hypothetical protein
MGWMTCVRCWCDLCGLKSKLAIPSEGDKVDITHTTWPTSEGWEAVVDASEEVKHLCPMCLVTIEQRLGRRVGRFEPKLKIEMQLATVEGD